MNTGPTLCEMHYVTCWAYSGDKTDVLDPMNLGFILLNISNLAARNTAKLSCNIATNEIKDLGFNSDCEEQSTNNISDT